MGGNYTLGGSTPDFVDFGAAAIVLNYGGVYAPVDIQVRDGIYSEQVELLEILGANSLNQVVFESENNDASLVTLSYLGNSSSDYVLRLSGTDWLTMKGMTIATESNLTYYIKVIELINGATHNTFLDNNLIGGTTNSTSLDRSVVYIPAIGVNEYNGFENNTISNGSAGIFIDGDYNNNLQTQGNYLIGNKFENQYHYGAYLIDYQKDVLISDNEFRTNTIYANYYALSLDDLTDNVSVLKNKIIGISGYGIYLNIDATGENTACLVANNFIQLDSTNTSYGIYSYYGNYQNIYHNTVSINTTNPDSRCFYNVYGSNKRIKNNIFSNTGGGYAYYINSTSGILESDYNNLYATGTYLAYSGGQLATLADWQSTTLDSNSVAIDPLFISDTDLHVTNVLLDSVWLKTTKIWRRPSAWCFIIYIEY